MIKKFNTNDQYFKWFNKNSNKIHILEVDTKYNIIVKYGVLKK